MKKLSAFVGFLIQILFFLMGVSLFTIAFKGYPDAAKQVMTTFLFDYKIAIFLGGFMLFLPILFVMTKLTSISRKKGDISFEDSEGKVFISNTAITDFVNRICNNYQEVHQSRTEVLPSKKSSAVIISIDLDMLGGTNIPDSSENLKKNIRRQLGELLGLENIESIDIHIGNIISQDIKTEEEY